MKIEEAPTQVIVSSESSFAFRGILLVSLHAFKIGPNRGLFINQRCILGDVFAKQAAARIKNGVVGNPGKIIPKKANITKMMPNVRNRNFRMGSKFNISPFF